MSTMTTTCTRLWILLALLIGANVAMAEAYPMRTVKIVVPYPPGGGTDMIARMVGQRLSTKWGQPVVVENRAGATGVIATELVAKSPPDGYTLFMGTTGELAVNPAVKADLPFNVDKDFAPIILISMSPLVLVVHPSMVASNLEQYVTTANAQPGKISYSSPGNGSPHHILGELIKSVTRIDVTHIPYKGGGPQLNDLLAGHTQSGILPLAVIAPHLKTGRLRALGVSSAKRVPGFPNLPTLAESGANGIDFVQWRGLLAPAGISPEIQSKIYTDTQEIVKQPEVSDRLRELAEDPVSLGPEEFSRIMRNDVAKYRQIVKTAQIRVD